MGNHSRRTTDRRNTARTQPKTLLTSTRNTVHNGRTQRPSRHIRNYDSMRQGARRRIQHRRHHLLPAASAILQEFRRRTSLPSIKSDITYEEYKEDWKDGKNQLQHHRQDDTSGTTKRFYYHYRMMTTPNAPRHPTHRTGALGL